MGTPFTKIAQLAAANTARDGSGTLVDVHTGNASNQTRLDRLRVQALGITTAGFIHAYIKKSGGSYRFIREWSVQPIAAQDIANGVPRWSLDIDCTLNSEALYLQSGDILALGTDKAESFSVMICGGDT